MMDVNETIAEREGTHGKFFATSRVAQDLKAIIRLSANGLYYSQIEREALDMICSKLSRILEGNPHEIDHWRDLAGYATLVARSLEK